MSTRKNQLPYDEDLDTPAYTVGLAAHYVRVHAATLRGWLGLREQMRPVIDPADKGPPALLSFLNLVEAHILNALRQQYHIRMSKVRSAVRYVERELGIYRPLANQRFSTDGADLFIEKAGGEIVDVSAAGQPVMPPIIAQALERIEWDAGSSLASGLFPYVRRPDGRPQQRPILIRPQLSFGRPVVSGTGIPTSILVERWVAGDGISHLAEDFRITERQVEDALRWEDSLLRAA